MGVEKLQLSGMLPRAGALKTPLKIIIPLWSVFLVFGFSIFFIFIPSFKAKLIQQKKLITQTLTDSAVSLLSEYHRSVQAGRLPLTVAQSRALDQIRMMRYGPEGKDYFWINDLHPTMLMHPYRPDLEGKDVTGFTDAKGHRLFVEMVELVAAQGKGYIGYHWQWKDTPHRIVPKLSYIKEFRPWGWIIGTGIYTEDVHLEIEDILSNLIRLFTGLLLFVLGLSAYITWQTFKIRNKKRAIETAFREETKTLSMILESTPHGIALVDTHGCYQYINPHFKIITGYTRKDLPTINDWFEKAYPDEAYRKAVMETWYQDNQNARVGVIREFDIRCKNGETKHIEFRSTFQENQKIIVLTDVTSRKESEKVRREKDRLQGVLELSATICHEMNQPLMSIEGYFDLILLDLTEEDPQYGKIMKIKAQLERMSDITKKLMELSRHRPQEGLHGKELDLAEPHKLEEFKN